MKLVTYQTAEDSRHLGALRDDGIVNLKQASGGELPDDMLAFLNAGEAAMQTAASVVTDAGETIDPGSVRLLSPVTEPSKVVAIGLNYMDHIRESGLPVPQLATMFCKYPSSVIGDGEAIRWSTRLTRQVDFEAELAVVIGKNARNVIEADAYDYIAGYMNCNDVSARDLQFREGDQWLRGKCLDTFCPLGPWLVTRDEIGDPHKLAIRCRVNNEIMQDSNTAEMIYRIPYLIEYLSEAFTLLPGDIIATGTPHGVGAFREPPVWLQSGDLVTVEIEGLGTLSNPCVVSP
ncbi:MAG: fumarylacetoacetate hydrolase family protein [Gammaproteobacteria bacterium]|jgi:2-keto-4-pentenoate hydratase/2-oxohepta-3-ene-1,7-dioic acid hydratase in catechol pathway